MASGWVAKDWSRAVNDVRMSWARAGEQVDSSWMRKRSQVIPAEGVTTRVRGRLVWMGPLKSVNKVSGPSR